MPQIFDRNAAYILEDDRVLLRPLKESDIEFLLPYALNEQDTWKYSGISAHGEERMRAYINTALSNRTEGKEYAFIVFDKTTGEYAGSTRFYDIQPGNAMLQLGYTWYGEKFRGTGLNKHCKFLLLQFAFEELGMYRVEFRADARNERSIAAMKSIGCTVEGILRSNMWLEAGGRRDSIVLSILKEEWEGGVKENLQSRL
ncbi:GNAT family N-acetyltransferase [Mucilaginibacter ginsenosidivorans]|uniref:GNAT family N-acetyltransferase n=1 Tax=Mucilaginibacter ginsenosidivorans TaxID=398053 RepID=A0A5B8UXN4_9SPHI|nr:GNAT family protein [Mucilaginibacter ginsenosidivorans]QEC63794.1 GNAT family N-acetyltransferase [Mucilaginibacter ginsenosidivorans]